MKKVILSLLLWGGSISLFSQDIEVKKFEPMAKDQTASLNPRKDINGVTCGLVKVSFDEEGLLFDGNIIGDVKSNPSEYWVYLSKGTKRINIKHPNYIPKTIVFGDYGVPKIESNNTYSLIIKGNKAKPKTNSEKKKVVIFQVNPATADLFIDDNLVPKEEDGAYAITLTHGIHFYSVKSQYFSINNQIVNVNSKTKTINIDLSQFYSKLNVVCSTKDVDIYVNQEKCGIEVWEGTVPPGEYIIEVRKKGLSSQKQSFVLHENDSICVKFNELTPVTGSLSVNYKPDGSEVTVDGEMVGYTPLHLNDLAIGEHRVSIKKDYYDFVLDFITIEEGQDYLMDGFLKYKDAFSKIWIEAHDGDSKAQVELAECYLYNRSWIQGWKKDIIDHTKAVYWYTKAAEQGSAYAQCQLSLCYGKGTGVAIDDVQAFNWAKKSAENGFDHGCYLLGWHYAYGRGVDKDMKEAVHWLRQAIILGRNSSAVELLKKLGYDNKIPSEYEIEAPEKG